MPSTACPATIASNALPPFSRIRSAARVASAFIAATAKCRPRTTGRIILDAPLASDSPSCPIVAPASEDINTPTSAIRISVRMKASLTSPLPGSSYLPGFLCAFRFFFAPLREINSARRGFTQRRKERLNTQRRQTTEAHQNRCVTKQRDGDSLIKLALGRRLLSADAAGFNFCSRVVLTFNRPAGYAPQHR